MKNRTQPIHWPRQARALCFFLLAAVGVSLSHARANDPAHGLFELAHTPVAEIQGIKEFIPKNGGGYDFLQYYPTQIGDAITFSVAIQQSGTKRMQVTTYKDGKEGIYSIEVNGQEVARKDFYESNVWDVGTFPIKPGVFRITFRCVGQSQKSGGMGLKLGTLHFR